MDTTQQLSEIDIHQAMPVHLYAKTLRALDTDEELFIESIKSELRSCRVRLPSAHQMADSLYISPRTFSRRLQRAGQDYRSIISEVRHETAIEYLLNSPHSIAYIAKQLGYADNSNFTKAFKSWTGMTPLSFRKQQSAEA